jgi:hypothetical protein
VAAIKWLFGDALELDEKSVSTGREKNTDQGKND